MALSAAAGLTTRNREGMTRISAVIVTSAVIYKHALVVQTAAGLAKPAANETTTTFMGLAERTFDTGDGTVTATCLENLEVLITMATAVTVGNLRQSKIYAVDDASVTTEATLGPECGVMTQFVAANSGWIRLRGGVIVVAS